MKVSLALVCLTLCLGVGSARRLADTGSSPVVAGLSRLNPFSSLGSFGTGSGTPPPSPSPAPLATDASLSAEVKEGEFSASLQAVTTRPVEPEPEPAPAPAPAPAPVTPPESSPSGGSLVFPGFTVPLHGTGGDVITIPDIRVGKVFSTPSPPPPPPPPPPSPAHPLNLAVSVSGTVKEGELTSSTEATLQGR